MSVCLTVFAQTFTVANADGVGINYKVVSAAEQKVNIAAGTYSGQVVVPGTVNWHDTVWTVSGMENGVFQNSTVTYVHFPETVVKLSNNAFNGCTTLDSLRFDSETPLTYQYSDLNLSFGTTFNWGRVTVYVPCGHLSEWKASKWGKRFHWITSDCAHRLTVLSNRQDLVQIDSVVVNSTVNYSNGMYEAGDNVLLTMRPRSFGYFLGWSDGSNEINHSYLMPDRDDTVYCWMDTIHYATLNVNAISTAVFQFGTMGYDGTNTQYTFRQIPGNPSTVWATGLWVGNNEAVAAQRFHENGYDFCPGPIRTTDATADMDTRIRYSRVWHLTREMIDYHIAHCGDAGYVPVDDILTWPANGDVSDGYAQKLAPYYDADSNGYYNSYAGDYPLIRGDECVFSIFNDQGIHGESGGVPLGIEVHAMIYAFNEPQDTALWNTIFVHYDVYNRSATTYNSTYFGAWTDFDIGYAWDDYVGCDVKHGMYYGYNGAQNDTPGAGSFTGVPPAQSCMILAGGLLGDDGRDNLKVDIDKILSDGYTNQQVKNLLAQYLQPNGTYDTAAITRNADLFYNYDYNSWYFQPGDATGNMAINGIGFGDGIVDNERIGMTNFTYYDNSTNSIWGEPMQASDYYNFMRGYWKNGQHIKYGGNGVSTGTDILDCNFMFPGSTDPWYWGTDGVVPDIDVINWNETTAGNYPGDRRGIGASGPFTFVAGSRQQLDVAYVTGFGETNNWSSVEMLATLGSSVRNQFMRDTTDSGRPFTYMPYSAPHQVAIDELAQPMLKVYPNPATGLVHIEVPQVSEVQLYDMMGHRLMGASVRNGYATLDLQTIPAGIYLLRAGGSIQRIVKK